VSIYDTTFTNIYDTTLVAVSDTLRVNVLWLSTGSGFNKAKIYPNPTKEKVVVDLGDYLKLIGHSIQVNNSLGQKVFQEPVSSRYIEIDLNSLGKAGTYVLIIKDNVGYPVVVKHLILL